MGGSGKRVKDPEKAKDKEVAAEAKEEKKQKRVVAPTSSQYTRVRVSGTDLNGDKPVVRAIMGIKGVGWIMSNAVCEVGKIDPSKKLRDFEEGEIKKLEDIIKSPVKYSVPSYLVNRRRDMKTGEDVHMTGADLTVSTRFDVQRHVDLKTYRGWRHMLGQPVRGQRTRSKFREKGRVVGVLRKAVRIAGAAPAAAGEKAKDTKEAKK